MSRATSIRGTKNEEHFRTAFVHQNAKYMVGGKFQIEKTDIYIRENGRKGRKIGDIDGHYIASIGRPLWKLLPSPHGLLDRDFFINNGDHVFFELTMHLCKKPLVYIEKKVKFHKMLVSGEAYEFPVDKDNHVLIFCFNGADNVAVTKAFQDLCKQHGIRGMAVYLASDVVDQWDLELSLAEQKRKLAKQKRKLVEQEHALAKQKREIYNLKGVQNALKP